MNARDYREQIKQAVRARLELKASELQVLSSNHSTTQMVMMIMPVAGLGPVPRKIVKFNPGLSQIWSKVFPSKNTELEVLKYCRAFTTR